MDVDTRFNDSSFTTNTMSLPPTIIPAKRRVRRKRRQTATAVTPPAPGAPALVAVVYVAGTSLRLTFDRAIDISAIDAGTIFVSDADVGEVLFGDGPISQPAAMSVQMGLAGFEPSTLPGVTLNAGAYTGIVAVDGGMQWAGAENVEIPF